MNALREPSPASELLKRPRLTSRITLGPGAPDVLIEAPRGSGRTCLLIEIARCARAAGIEPVWLDTLSFAEWRSNARLTDALSRLPAPSGPDHRIILIDDADLADHRQLERLLDRVRPWQVVLVSEGGVPMSHAVKISEIDLRFTESETALLLGHACPEPEVLGQLCQGNVLGLSLIRGALDRGIHFSPDIQSCAPVGAGLSLWLDTVLWPTLPPDVQRFLLAIAPLEDVDGDLAHAATGGRDAWALLDRLHPLGLPIERRDPMTGRLRLHSVIRDYLMRCARRDGIDTGRSLRNVANWLGQQGQFRQAAQMAMQGGDAVQARCWSEAEGGWRIVICGDGGWLSRLCDELSLSDLATQPGLALGLALHLSRMGDPAGARELIASLPRGIDQVDDRLIVESILDGYDDRPFGPDDERRLRGLLARRGENDPLLRGVVTNVLAARYLQYGRFHEVTALAETSAEAYEAARARLGAALVRCQAAQAWGFLGEAQRGLEILDKVASQSIGAGMTPEPLAAISNVLRAEILARENRHEDAARLLRDALSVVENGDAWHDVLAAAYQTLMRLPERLRPFGDEIALIRRGLALAKRRNLPRLAMLLAAHAGPDIRAELLATLPPVADWPPDPRRPAAATPQCGDLSSREAEALRHLADGLTVKEIAVSMGLSENTVKYHIKRLHTRLGVNRRSQLIQAARRLALLP